MKQPTTRTTCILLVMACLSSAMAGEVDKQREFDYLGGSEKGPNHWGELHEEWSACKNGTMQSPIDLSNQRAKLVRKDLQFLRSYQPCPAILKNRGHDISVQWRDSTAGKININGTDFFLKQAHWHSPSEHTIDGRRYDLELHMVHQNSENKIAVVGVLYKIGSPDPFLSKLIGKVMEMKDKEEERDIGIVDPTELRVKGSTFYRYIGSLTTPPCTEGVIWTVKRRIKDVSVDQVKALRDAVLDYAEQNARPVQEQHQREINLFRPDEL